MDMQDTHRRQNACTTQSWVLHARNRILTLRFRISLSQEWVAWLPVVGERLLGLVSEPCSNPSLVQPYYLYVTLGISPTNSSHTFTLELSLESTHFPMSSPLTSSASHHLTSGLLKYIHNYFPGFCPFPPNIQIYLRPRLVLLCSKPSSGFLSYSEENPVSSMDIQSLGGYLSGAHPHPITF